MKKQRAERLRTTVDFLPPETKRAMLDGLERNRIITGANTDRRGGMCPMIAADRNAFQSGPMADIFAAVWDSYNGACILNRRDASDRDLRVLKTMLETSLANSPELSSELGQAWLDYHTGPESATTGAAGDFDRELTAALEQSSMLDTGAHAPVSTPPAADPPPAARRIELVYDGPVPARPAPAPTRASQVAPTDPQAAKPAAPAATLTSTYEPYKVAAPRRQAQPARKSVDVESRAARHAAETTASAERARARAIIANQAATLHGRSWPRSADARPVAPAPRPEPDFSAFAAPAIRQAAIPQRRTAPDPTPAAAAARERTPTGASVAAGAGPGQAAGRTDDAQGRTGWSLLPPARSYDDHRDVGAPAGPPTSRPGGPDEVRPPDEQQRRTVRT